MRSDRGRVAVLGEHRDDLLDEERVALGGAHDLCAGVVVERPAGELRDQGRRLVGGEGLEGGVRRSELAAAPARASLEQFGPRQAEQEDRRATAPVAHVVDQIEQRRVGPLDVVEDGHHRPVAGERLEEPPGGPRDLLGGRLGLGPAEEGAEHGADARRVLVARQQGLDRGGGVVGLLTERVAEQLGEREPGDAVAVGEAPAADDGRLRTDPGEELTHQPGFACPGRREHGPQARTPGRRRTPRRSGGAA